MGGRFGKYGDTKRKALIRKNRLREKNMFKTYAHSARTSHLSVPFVICQADEFVRVKLDARSEAGLLFRKRIGVTCPGLGNSRQLLLSDLTNSG
jgi:hypothetical protein